MEEFRVGVLNLADLTILATALAAMLGVGLWASRRMEKTAKGFFLASGKMPWWLIGAAFVSTSVSSEQLVGTVGRAYKDGMGVANWEWFTLPTYTLVLLFFIPLYLGNRVTTVPELLARRFGPLCADFYSWVMLFAYVFLSLATILYGSSLALAGITGKDFYVILWATAFLVGIYTVKGGLESVMWTDALQCLLLVGGGLLLFFWSLNQVPGGWSAMQAASPERFHLYHPPDDPVAPFLSLVAGALGVFLFYQGTNQVMIQRVLSARSTWDGMMGIIFAGFINLLRPLLTCFLGFIVYHWIHHVMDKASPLENLDHAFPFALTTFAPDWGLRGVVLAGFLAAVMAAASGQVNATATIFSLDIYKKMFDRSADDRRLVLVGRIASVVALAAACLVAPQVEHMGGIFTYFQTGVTYLATPFISVILMGIFWKRTNYQGALFGIFGGTVLVVGLGVGSWAAEKYWHWVPWHWLYVAFLAQVLIMLGVAVVSLLTPAPDPAAWGPFLWTPAVLKHYDEGVRRPWYKRVLLWYAVYAAIWCTIYWWFW